MLSIQPHSPETELLLAAASVADPQLSRELAPILLTQAPDWDALLHKADRHRLKPLLCRFLESVLPLAVPPNVLSALRQTRQDNTQYNLHLTGELWSLLELFSAQGIEALPIKGPTLAMLAFDDLAGREFLDLDLLIAEQDLPRIAELLVARGYHPWIQLEAVYDETFRRITNVLEFLHSEKCILVEVHWKLSVGLLPLDLSEAWRERRLVQTSPGGKRMHTFAPEPLLVYLCVHAAKHCWSRLNWAADIAWLLKRQTAFDWEYVLTLARQQRCSRTLRLGLFLANNLLAAQLPPKVKAELEADGVVKKLAHRVVYWWTLPAAEAPGPNSGLVERNRFFFAMQDDWRRRLCYLSRLLLAPNLNDWKFVRLPVKLIYLYVLLRPVRFLLSLLISLLGQRNKA